MPTPTSADGESRRAAQKHSLTLDCIQRRRQESLDLLKGHRRSDVDCALQLPWIGGNTWQRSLHTLIKTVNGLGDGPALPLYAGLHAAAPTTACRRIDPADIKAPTPIGRTDVEPATGIRHNAT